MARVRIVRTVDDTFMVLVDGIQWGGDRDRSGAGNATFPTVADAVGAFRDCGNTDVIEDEDGQPIEA